MKIEDAIQQRSFKNEYAKASINLIYTAGWLQGLLRDSFKEHDISTQQYNVLRILRGQHPNAISTCDVRSRMLDKMSDASRIVARLNKAGLVNQKINKEDKRLVDVVITQKGLNLLAKLDVKLEEAEDALKTITREEAKTLNEILDKMRS